MCPCFPQHLRRGGFVIYFPVSDLIADDLGRMLIFACFLTVRRKI